MTYEVLAEIIGPGAIQSLRQIVAIIEQSGFTGDRYIPKELQDEADEIRLGKLEEECDAEEAAQLDIERDWQEQANDSSLQRGA